jgi:glutamate-ammonia-ligase adenylyltransferase
MLAPTKPFLPRAIAAFLDERLARLEAACRDAGVPFYDDAGVDDHLERVLLASDFAYESFLRDPSLLGPDLLRLMSDPRHADARAGVLAAASGEVELAAELRLFRQREAIRLIWRDLNDLDTVETTLAGASVLAETCIEAALACAERKIATRHGAVRDASGGTQRMVVFGLGKLGGGELNFSSDIDLVFAFAEDGTSDGARPLDAEAYYARVAQAFVALIAERDANGYVYRVDLRLRPFGHSGRTVLSFAAMEQYYQREGRDWERYAWIKARAVGGDRIGGARLLDTLRPFVFRRYLDYSAFAGLREMKALIDAEVARKDLADDLKLGPGGIREIEFIVQLVQLIRGGREPALRARGLLPALAAAEQLGFIPSGRAIKLRDAYRFLRRVENRVQMFADQQTHAIPEDIDVRERIALALGWPAWSALADVLAVHRAAVAEEFAALMAADQRAEARRGESAWIVLWRSIVNDGVDRAALRSAGFDPADDVASALESLLASSALRNMSARSRERLDRVMPTLLAAAAGSAEPARCLVPMLRLVQAVARRSVYLVLLDEQPAALRRLSTVLTSSTFLAERVIAHPLLLDDLFDDRGDAGAPDRELVAAELARRLDALGGGDAEAEIELIQEARQSALFRIGLAFLGGRIDAIGAARALAEVAEVALNAVLRIALRDLAATHGRLPGALHDAGGFAVIAYGSFGGSELGFGSDLDLVFLYDGALAQHESDGARALDGVRWFTRLAQRVVHLLDVQTRAGKLYEVDVRLRPDGGKGLLVLGIDAYEAYLRERAWTWELQALVRARAVAGDPALGARFARVRSALLAAPRDTARVREEIGSMRARWRAERDRSDAERFDLKQGAGGLVDIEFLLQGIVLLHAATKPALLEGGGTPSLIAAAAEAGVLSDADARTLADAHAALLARAIACTLDGRPRIAVRDAQIEQAIGAVRAVAQRPGLLAF